MPKKTSSTHTWPFLRSYQGSSLDRTVLPVGGIGTGTIGFSGYGALRDWEIMNVPAKGFVPLVNGQINNPCPTLLLRYAVKGQAPAIKVLEGSLPYGSYEGAAGSVAPTANLPRFRHVKFRTAYPLGEVILRDPACPLHVRLQSFNPFAPHDAEGSGWPVAFFRCVLTNPLRRPVSASAVFSLPNFIGTDGTKFTANSHNGRHDEIGFKDNVNSWKSEKQFAGIFMSSNGVDANDPAWGTMSLTTPTQGKVSFRTSWADLSWGDAYLDFWDELLVHARLTDRPSKHADGVALPGSRRLARRNG